MGSQDSSLSMFQSLAAQGQQQPAQGQDGGDSSLNLFRDIAGATPVKMVGPKGEIKSVPSNGVADARSNNFMVHPDNPGAQRMVTPKGQTTYALPSEVDAFKASGHTVINSDGSFRVDPLPGEDNIDTMERAKKVIKSLSYAERDKAMNAEIHPFDPRPVSSGGSGLKGAGRLAIHGVVAPIAATAATTAALAGGSEIVSGLEAGGTALANTEAGQLFMSSPRLYAEYLLKNPATRAMGLKALTQLGKAAATGAGMAAGWKIIEAITGKKVTLPAE